MSHRWDCPSRWEAERKGEDDYRHRERENPYAERYGREGCPEAERAWDEGYRHAERRDEERQAEEAASERHARDAAAARRYEQEQEEAYYLQQPPEPEPNYCAMQGHPYSGNDSTGPRCMCGERRDFPPEVKP